MRKIFKPEYIVKTQSFVQIPDVEFKKEPDALTDENGEPLVLTEEIYQKIRKELREEVNSELARKKLDSARERDLIVSKARKDAKKLMDEATNDRRRILDEARNSAEQLKREAYMEGLKKGIEEKSELLENLAESVSRCIELLEHNEDEYFDEYAKQLKYIAVDITEKIIYQKIQEDDMTMYNLVKNAIRSARDASWIKAEVSEKLFSYVDSLEKELSVSGINAEIIASDGVPDDHCVLNTSDGFIVASISQQLANLKEYINRQDKSGNDENAS